MWREAQLRDIASGVHTTALGIRPCHCKRRWPCDLCGESFVCWNVWPFLWDTIPRTLRNKKLCRRCYGGQLLDVLGVVVPAGHAHALGPSHFGRAVDRCVGKVSIVY